MPTFFFGTCLPLIVSMGTSCFSGFQKRAEPQTKREEPDNVARPKFDFFEGRVLDDVAIKAILESTERSNMSYDATSIDFAPRDKAIRFVMVVNGQVQPLAQSYFKMDERYNDLSGGFRRYYNQIDDEILQGVLSPVVMKFMHYYGYPEKTLILVQYQRSSFGLVQKSVTGQGIHTDGANHAMLVGLERGEGVQGALNEFHDEIDGSAPLCDPTLLQPGFAVAWKDNEIYHNVTPATGSADMNNVRTMLLLNAPAELYLQGLANPMNTLTTQKTDKKQRSRLSVVEACDHA